MTDTGWRPIETAPRDEYVLVFRAGVSEGAASRICIGLMRPRGRWVAASNAILAGRGAPTHWQPLPEPPAGDER